MKATALEIQQGFTLIELMVVVSIIGILAATALPVYQKYTVKIRLTEGFLLVAPAKAAINEIVTGTDLVVAATVFNNTHANSKYVEQVNIDVTTGVITIKFNALSVGLEVNQNTMTLTPYIVGAPGNYVALDTALANGISGPLDWACASETSDAAVARGMPSTALGVIGVKSEFSTSDCR